MEYFQALIDAAGQNWLIALGLSFVAIAMDTAKPKTEEGGRIGGPLAWAATGANIATQLLLLAHGYCKGAEAQNPLALAIALGIVVAVVAGAATLGFVLGLLVPAVRKPLALAAPLALLAAFAFTLWVTYGSVLNLLGSVSG